MIRKTLFSFILLFFSYQLLMWTIPQFSSFQHQWQENKVIAERYLYGQHQSQVILGSSLATRLDMTQLPDYYKMTFGGLGIFDGLAIILTKDSMPETVFIETNFLLRKQNITLKEELQNPVAYKVKKTFTVFRAEKQPVGFAIESIKLLRRWFKGDPLFKTKMASDSTYNKIPETLDSSVRKIDDGFFNYMMQSEARKFSTLPDTLLLEQQINLLKTSLNFLTTKGVNVVLFEMPIAKELQNLAVPNAIRQAINEAFADMESVTIWPAFPNFYVTEDGLHLGWKEAKQFTFEFKKRIKKAPLAPLK